MSSISNALFRAFCANIYDNTLRKMHEPLCHLGVICLHHFVDVKNLPYSVDEVCNVFAKCKNCSELRPNFYKPQVAYEIKANQPFKKLLLNFKCPSSKNCYVMTIIDKYSRFSFGFACSNVNAKTVISFLNQMFVMFSVLDYIHSDKRYHFYIEGTCKLFAKT